MKCICGKKCIPFDSVFFCVENGIVIFYRDNGHIDHVDTSEKAIYDGLMWWKSYKVLKGLMDNNAKTLKEISGNAMKLVWEKMKKNGSLDKYLTKKANGVSVSGKT